jgi:prepilin-type N-terminal cleavage/methylation domain-containing protein
MSYLQNLKQKREEGGFTLVETLIAIAVLSLAVTGPMTIAQKSIASAMYARDQVMASYLAQDAIEYVRNVRDTNRLTTGVSWLNKLDECVTQDCVINSNISIWDGSNWQDAIWPANASNERMYFDKADYIYNHQNGVNSAVTQFTRRVRVTEVVPNREADVTATVSWKPNAFSVMKTFVATERLFNFKP